MPIFGLGKVYRIWTPKGGPLQYQQKIHFLGTNPPIQIQEVCQRHLSKTNSHLHQMQATKTISPRRQSRNSVAPNEREQDIQDPKN